MQNLTTDDNLCAAYHLRQAPCNQPGNHLLTIVEVIHRTPESREAAVKTPEVTDIAVCRTYALAHQALREELKRQQSELAAAMSRVEANLQYAGTMYAAPVSLLEEYAPLYHELVDVLRKIRNDDRTKFKVGEMTISRIFTTASLDGNLYVRFDIPPQAAVLRTFTPELQDMLTRALAEAGLKNDYSTSLVGATRLMLSTWVQVTEAA